MMTCRSALSVVTASVFLALCGANHCFCAPTPEDPIQNFRQTLQKFASEPPDPCTSGIYTEGEKARVESTLFGLAVDIVTAELNATPAKPIPPVERATEALKNLERMSAEINAAWPNESRFHFQVLDIPPAFVVKVSFRIRARYFVFGVPEDHQWNPDRLWRQVGYDEESLDPTRIGCSFSVDLYPLHRGPSGNARFLSKFTYIPCAGVTFAASYDAYEWNPKDSGNLEQLIKQEGSFGLDASEGHIPTPKDPFAPIGLLLTEGPVISLPYCWFSAIDTWDNPSMCAVDSYDLSKDDIKFRSRSYNRPDLLPIAKAIEYAEKRDYPAVLGYCTSDEVARRLVRDTPVIVFAGDLQVTRKGDEREHVEMDGYRFDVAKRAGRWLIVDFSAK